MSASSWLHRIWISAKTARQIGDELGVRYLLIGKVRWAKGPKSSRVQVSPELVDTKTAQDARAEPFNAPITDNPRFERILATANPLG